MTPTGQTEDGPRHIAIIMDGNGRWAKARGRPRVFGHQQGVEAVRAVVRAGGDLGVNCLTLYGFSTENWRRPHEEVDALFGLLRRFVDADLESLAADGVRVRILGRREGLSDDIIEIIERAERRTADNSAFSLNIAFNYGGRDCSRRETNCRRGCERRTVRRRDRRGRIRGASGFARPARSRPRHPDERRAAPVELPALANRLRRARLRRCAVAGF